MAAFLALFRRLNEDLKNVSGQERALERLNVSALTYPYSNDFW
jgi:hypothetical protein